MTFCISFDSAFFLHHLAFFPFFVRVVLILACMYGVWDWINHSCFCDRSHVLGCLYIFLFSSCFLGRRDCLDVTGEAETARRYCTRTEFLTLV